MKQFAIILLCLVTVTASASGASPEISFSSWTDTEYVSVPATDGTASLARQQAIATVVYDKRPEPYLWPVDLVYDPESDALWFGHQYERYCVVNGRIVGLSPDGNKLRIRRSHHRVDDLNDEVLMQAVQRFKERFRPVGRDKDVLLSLPMLYGRGNLRDKFDVRPRSSGIDITDIKISNSKIHCTFYAQETEKTLRATFDNEFNTLALNVDNRSWPVLSRGFIHPDGRNLLNGWSSANWLKIPSENGNVEVVYKSKGSDLSMVFAPSNDSIWVGPGNVEFAMVGGRVVGVEVRNQRLCLYATSHKVPEGADVVKFVADTLKVLGVSQQGFEPTPDIRVELDEVFGSGRIVPEQTEISRTVRIEVKERMVEMTLTTFLPRGKINIKLDKELRPVSFMYDGEEVATEIRESHKN